MKSVHSLTRTLCCLLALFVSPLALALDSDREQPIKIQADSAILDDATGVTVYKGDVVVTQGSIQITGDQVTLLRENQELDSLSIIGKPAHFKQQIEGSSAFTEAFGNTLNYSATTEVLVASVQAKVINDRDTFTGQTIRYDLKNKRVQATGSPASSGKAPGRVEMIIQPRAVSETSR